MVKKNKSRSSRNSSKRKSRKFALNGMSPLKGDEQRAFLENLDALTATIDKLKKTELELQAEVAEIKRDTAAARTRYQSTVRKVIAAKEQR